MTEISTSDIIINFKALPSQFKHTICTDQECITFSVCPTDRVSDVKRKLFAVINTAPDVWISGAQSQNKDGIKERFLKIFLDSKGMQPLFNAMTVAEANICGDTTVYWSFNGTKRRRRPDTLWKAQHKMLNQDLRTTLRRECKKINWNDLTGADHKCKNINRIDLTGAERGLSPIKVVQTGRLHAIVFDISHLISLWHSLFRSCGALSLRVLGVQITERNKSPTRNSIKINKVIADFGFTQADRPIQMLDKISEKFCKIKIDADAKVIVTDRAFDLAQSLR